MSTQVSLPGRTHELSFTRRALALTSVGAGRLLARVPPARLRTVLQALRRGAAPASTGRAQQARQDVCAVSLLCAGDGCLPRSLATAVLCRMRGTWPTWCVGVRIEPFHAHAWVEAEGSPVDEPFATGYYSPIITVE